MAHADVNERSITIHQIMRFCVHTSRIDIEWNESAFWTFWQQFFQCHSLIGNFSARRSIAL